MVETDKGYVIAKNLVHVLAGSILAALLGLAGYMVQWNSADKQWKKGVDLQVIAIFKTMEKIEHKVDAGILPQAKWRLDQVETWMSNHSTTHHQRVNP